MATTAWKIATSGPLLNFSGTVEDAMKHVETYALLRRGWTGQWRQDADGSDRWVYVRFNSKGREMKGYQVYLTPTDQ